MKYGSFARRLATACQLGLGGIYLLSASGKLVYPRGFFRAVADYRMLPDPFVALVASSLPGVEFLAGLLLVLGVYRGWRPLRVAAWAAAASAALMLVAFIVVLSFNLVRGIEMDCGCFDLLGYYIPYFKPSKATWWTVVRDVVMLAIAMPVLTRRDRR